MRDNKSENWCKQLVGPGGQKDHKGGQGVYREVESERHEEKDRAVIKEATPDEPVGQRWARSSPHYGDEGATHSPIATRCMRAARSGRTELCPQENSSRCRCGSGISDPISKQAKRGVKRGE